MDYSEYDNYFEQHGIKHYERDGALDENLWNSSNKILFVLKETAGYDKCPNFDLKDEIPSWLKNKNRTYTKIAKLALALHKAFERNSSLTKEECNNLTNNHSDLLDALKCCAVINIKKTSNKFVRSYDKEILDHFHMHRSILQNQIQYLSPNIVIAGSSVCWQCLSGSKNGLYKDNIRNSKLSKHECAKFDDIVFYHANHPSAWLSGGFDIAKIQNQIFTTWINKQNNLLSE